MSLNDSGGRAGHAGPTRQTNDFSLVKWYLDCVDGEGRAMIAYWAALVWRGLSFTWHSVELHQEGRPVTRRWSLQPSPPPDRAQAGLVWTPPALGCDITVEVGQPPFAIRLMEGESGIVNWAVQSPVGCVTAIIAGVGTIHGDGYAERLELSLPPWRLPITELRWGRCVSSEAARGVVWIDWQGPPPRHWVLVDGRVQPDARVSDREVSGGGFTLRLAPQRRLVHRALAEILVPLSTLRSLVPDSLMALSETKWLGFGQLRQAGKSVFTAPALYEVVHMG